MKPSGVVADVRESRKGIRSSGVEVNIMNDNAITVE